MGPFVLTRRSVLLIGAGFLICLVGYVFYSFSPYDSGLFPRCPVLASTGYQCTGCGSQRAIHDLLHFRFTSAFSSNPLVLFAIPYMLLGYIAEWKAPTSIGWSRFRKTLFGVRAIWVILAIVVVFTVGRNVV